MKKIAIIFVAVVALIAPISPVFAGTATGALNIQANLLSSCSVSISPVDFGAISSPFNATAIGDVTVNCPSGFPYNIALDAGTYYTAGGQYRSLVGGDGSVIYYNLAKQDGETWGDSITFPFGTPLADTSNGGNQSHPVTGTLQGGSTAPGVYAGIVQVTVNW